MHNVLQLMEAAFARPDLKVATAGKLAPLEVMVKIVCKSAIVKMVQLVHQRLVNVFVRLVGKDNIVIVHVMPNLMD